MSWLKETFVKHGEKYIINRTGDKAFSKKWVSKIYNFWSIVLKVVSTVLIIMVVRNRAFGMIDSIGFEKTVITFVVVITIVTIRNSKFVKAEK